MIATIKKTSNRIKYTLITGFLLIAIIGCGGIMDSGSSGSSDMQFGRFINTPVHGLNYETETQTGITDKDGTFMYMPGETITFYIGDTELGSADAQSVMTPVHLIEGAVDETDPMVTNLGMLMQSLDEDGNPENGITISPEVSEEVSKTVIDFHLSNTDFQTQEKVTELFDSMNDIELFSNGDHIMISPEDAKDHMRDYMMPYMNAVMEEGMGQNSGQSMGHSSDQSMGDGTMM